MWARKTSADREYRLVEIIMNDWLVKIIMIDIRMW